MVAYQNRIAKLYNKKVRQRSFQVGDLVLKNAKATKKNEHEKLSEKLQGPYMIPKDCSIGTYKLQTSNVELLKHKRNIRILKRYYV